MTDDVDDEPADPALSGNDPEVVDAKKMLGLFDQPAFMRRAKQLEFELERFDAGLLATRREYLAPVAMRYKMLKLAQQKTPGKIAYNEFQSWVLEKIAQEVEFDTEPLAAQVLPPSPGVAWNDLTQSVRRFNRRWEQHVTQVKLDQVNAVIDGYNKHYLLEKECVTNSSKVAQKDYEPRQPITVDSILTRFPYLEDLQPGE